MIGRCMPAGVLPDARIFCTSAGYRSGFSSLYLSWNSRGFFPGIAGAACAQVVRPAIVQTHAYRRLDPEGSVNANAMNSGG